MIRRPPRSTLSSSSAASDVYKRQGSYRRALMMAPHKVWLITAVGPPPWAITIDDIGPPGHCSVVPLRASRPIQLEFARRWKPSQRLQLPRTPRDTRHLGAEGSNRRAVARHGTGRVRPDLHVHEHAFGAGYLASGHYTPATP